MAAEDVGAHALAADIAGEQERYAARTHIGGADRVLGLPHAPHERRRLLRREHLGDALELLARHAGDALDLLGRPLLDFLLDVLEAVDALLDEFLVLPAVLDDVPHHPVQHRDVGAGTQPDIVGGMRGGAGQARVDDDQIRPIHLLAFEDMLQRYRMGFGRIAAHDDHGLGIADVVEAVGHRAVAPGIGHAGDGGRMADARLVIGVVGAPEGADLTEKIRALFGHLGGAEPIDRVRARLAADVDDPVADLVDRLIPRDARPLAARKLHRVAQAAVAVHELADRGALAAVRAAVDRRIPARFLADPHPVRHFRRHGAADRAMGADALAHGSTRGERPGIGGLRLAHRGERQCAARRETAGSEAGAAQERAAVEASARMLAQRGRKRTAAGLSIALAFASLDQHGAPPYFEFGYRLTR